MTTPTRQEIEAVWERHHIERLPGHDMSNEYRLAAVILALEKELAEAAPKTATLEEARVQACAATIKYRLNAARAAGAGAEELEEIVAGVTASFPALMRCATCGADTTRDGYCPKCFKEHANALGPEKTRLLVDNFNKCTGANLGPDGMPQPAKTDMDLLAFSAYQEFTQTTARYPGKGEASAEALAYTICGLTGEVGEVVQPFLERIHATLQGIPKSQHTLAVQCQGESAAEFDARMRRRQLARLGAALSDFDEAARELELMKREFREKEAKLPPLVEVPAEYTARVMKELGDCLWYVATHSKENKLQLSWVIAENIRKLRDRAARGTLHGKGDNR
jgi:NTP pyrophosphatase (non-canonical NTP hydrolase)